jgi:perosamine synthetase
MQAVDRGGLGVALLVDASGVLRGIVTDGDLRRALLDGHGLESRVEGIAQRQPVSARHDDPLDKVAALFTEVVRVIPLLDRQGRVADLAIRDQRLRLPVAAPSIGERELQYVTECILSGWISSTGPFVQRFESAFAQYCGVRQAIATSNGTTALHLALLALGVGPGDEVIVPTLSFIATANAVTYCGAKPVFVDSDPRNWNIDPEAVAAAITPRTRAIIPVHLYGHPADLDPILAVARRHDVAVVEDAAEAHGALYKGRQVGGLGVIGAFSFYGNKIVTTGEGGMLTTSDDDLAARIRQLRDHGMSATRRYWHPVLGYNYRLTNLQAAVGVAQMEKIDAILERKQRLADAYAECLQDVPGVTLPPAEPWARSVHWLYSILIDPVIFGRTRDEIIDSLHAGDIETRPVFPPMHTQPIYAGENPQSLPVAERISTTGLSLPSSVTLELRDVERVATAIRDLASAAGAAPSRGSTGAAVAR